jgi:ferredoxin
VPRIRFVRERLEVEVPAGANLGAVMSMHGVDLQRTRIRFCRGHGICAGCRVYLKSGEENVSERTFIERLRMALGFFSIGHEGEVRLACQTRIEGDVSVETEPAVDWFGRPWRYVTRDSD